MLAGLLTQRLAKRAAAFSLLVGLLACASPLPVPVPTAPASHTVELAPAAIEGALIAKSAQGLDVDAMAAKAVLAPLPLSVADPFASPLPEDVLRPALLGGEPAREFERGGASWYGPGFHGRRTASGERYDMNAMTAAHRTLPFGTLVRVHSLVNGREVDVRITDRGPFSHSRVIDVSRAAAEELGMLGLGFKEVVLLVPESMQPMSGASSAPVKKTRRASRRLRPSKPR